MFQISTSDNASFNILLKDILTAFAKKWALDKGANLLWIAHTGSEIQSRLNHGFFSSRLFKLGARGLTKVNDHNYKSKIENNENWKQTTHLRGTVVICCDKKVLYANQGIHRKHAVHISDVCRAFEEYAVSDPYFESVLKYFTVSGEDVYFTPSNVIAENDISPSEDEDNNNESISHQSQVTEPEEKKENDSESPPPMLIDIEPLLIKELREYITLVDEQLKNNDIVLADTRSFFDLVKQLEDNKDVFPFSPEQEILYHISLAFCASTLAEKEIAIQAMNHPDLTGSLENSAQAFYHYYCLSVIAMKIEHYGLSKAFIDKSLEKLSKEESDNHKFIASFAELVNSKSAFFDMSTGSENNNDRKRLSITRIMSV